MAVGAASGSGTDAVTACGAGRGSLPARQEDDIKGTSGKPESLYRRVAYAGNATTHDRENAMSRSSRVKGGCCGHGLGSLVNCRRLPSVLRGLKPEAGLDIPCGNLFLHVPGVGSRAVMPPENTA